MSHPGLHKKTDGEFTTRQKAILFVVAPVLFVVMVVSLGTPIPRGTADRKQALAFLHELFPDRDVTGLKTSADAIAVVFNLIRSAESHVALRAIRFADEHQLGHAIPYAIQRLGSGDEALEQAARGFLQNITGADYGSDADAWWAWWRNPPRNLLGVVVGTRTFAIAVPATFLLAGVLLTVIGAGGVLLAFAWFNLFGLAGTRLMAKHNTCVFDSSLITYYSDHGNVVGLEDSRLAGGWLVFVLIAAFMIGPFLLVWGCLAAHSFWLRLRHNEG
jgi:hypothetical protein